MKKYTPNLSQYCFSIVVGSFILMVLVYCGYQVTVFKALAKKVIIPWPISLLHDFRIIWTFSGGLIVVILLLLKDRLLQLKTCVIINMISFYLSVLLYCLFTYFVQYKVYELR